MRHPYLVCLPLLAAACSSTPQSTVDTQTVRDYIEVGELEDVQYIRVYAHDSCPGLPITSSFTKRATTTT